MLTFQNKSLIPEAAITVSGVSVKVGDNPIGVFGTGLKYAIAIILRNGGHITILRGKKRLVFTLVSTQIRGQEFKIVAMNGRKLGFTDRLGLNWKPWMAYRELFSNCKDEGGVIRTSMESIDEFQGVANMTTICVSWPEFERIHENRHEVILQTDPWIVGEGVDVHPGESKFVFYKGIRVYELPKTSRYTYNITRPMELTEDRTFLYSFMAAHYAASMVLRCSNVSYLKSILSMDDDDSRKYWESDFNYETHKDILPSPQFVEIADYLSERKILHTSASHYYRSYVDTHTERTSPFLVQLNDAEFKIFDEAISLVSNMFVDIPHNFVMFKSTTSSPVSIRRGHIELDHGLIAKGVDELARRIVYGKLLLIGGDQLAQLSNWVLRKEFMSDMKNRKIERDDMLF